MCQELLAHEEALWTFVREERVEPTNTAAEQALRPAVLWRKGCFGAHSDAGNRFVERILTVSATCRKQQRHLLTFVTGAIEAQWAGRPAPALLPLSSVGFFTRPLSEAVDRPGVVRYECQDFSARVRAPTAPPAVPGG